MNNSRKSKKVPLRKRLPAILGLAAAALLGLAVAAGISRPSERPTIPTPTYILYPTATYTPSPSPTATATYTPSPTATMTATPTPTPSPTPTKKPTPTYTPDPCYGATSRGARKKFSFEQIVPCLNDPEKIVTFMRNNLMVDAGYDSKKWGTNTYASARTVYENGVDDCDGMAEFAGCLLKKNGYEAYNVGISTDSSWGHNVTGFVGRDGKLYAINNGQSIDGPFNSWEELAKFYIDRGYAEPNKNLVLYPVCLSKDYIGSEVGTIPAQYLR